MVGGEEGAACTGDIFSQTWLISWVCAPAQISWDHQRHVLAKQA